MITYQINILAGGSKLTQMVQWLQQLRLDMLLDKHNVSTENTTKDLLLEI